MPAVSRAGNARSTRSTGLARPASRKCRAGRPRSRCRVRGLRALIRVEVGAPLWNMSRPSVTVQLGGDLFTRVRAAATSGALFGTAAAPIFAKTPEECNAKYGANQDRIKASPRSGFLLLGFAQSVSAAARFNAHERPSASFGERVMPPSDRVVVQQEHRGDFRLRTRRVTRRRLFTC
jgi:hypothetical protein